MGILEFNLNMEGQNYHIYMKLLIVCEIIVMLCIICVFSVYFQR